MDPPLLPEGGIRAWVGEQRNNLCLPRAPGGVQVLQSGHTAANLCSAEQMTSCTSVFVLGSGGGTPDGDGGRDTLVAAGSISSFSFILVRVA